MGSVGLVRTTTKEIAREAGCSEAALYKHFQDKEAIFVGVLRERSPRLADELDELPAVPARARWPRTCGRWRVPRWPSTGAASRWPPRSSPIRRCWPRTAAGWTPRPTARSSPPSGWPPTSSAEQRLGRLSAAVEAEAAAALLIGACFHRAFLTVFWGADAPETAALRPSGDEEFAAQTVRALLAGAGPRGTE